MRDDMKLYKDKEPELLSPANKHYVTMAKECIQSRICVDLFYASNSYKSLDITTIAPLASLTGGDFHLFNNFDVTKHGEKLHYELFRNLTRTQGTEVQFKARTSTGISVTEYFGSFLSNEAPDIELAAIDADKTIGFSLKIDEKLKDNSMAFL